MKTIILSGIVGLDITPADVRRQLAEAKGGPVACEINSEGGSVTAGLEIYHAIKNYAGKKTARVVGIAASMASAILCAFDHVTAERASTVMLHHPSAVALGDHRDMERSAGMLRGFTALLVGIYAEKMHKSAAAVEKMLDAETWLFSQEAVDAGMVDGLVGTAPVNASMKAAAVARARSAVSASSSRLVASGHADSLDAIAACVAPLATATPAGFPWPGLEALREPFPKQYAAAKALGAYEPALEEPDDYGLLKADWVALKAAGLSDAEIRECSPHGIHSASNSAWYERQQARYASK